MENSPDPTQTNQQSAPAQDPSRGEISRIGGLFFEPGATLADIARRPTWVLPLILGLVMIVIPMYLHTRRVDPDAQIKAQVKQAIRFVGARADPAQLEQEIRRRSQTFWGQYGNFIMILGGGTVVTLALAGILLLAYILAGTTISYKLSLSMYCWSGLAPTIVLSLLAILFLFIKDPFDLNPLDPFSNVLSNPAFLVKEETQPVLASLLGSIDVFSFWRIYLLGVAFSAASLGRLRTGGATAVIVVLWVLYVMLKLALVGVFS